MKVHLEDLGMRTDKSITVTAKNLEEMPSKDIVLKSTQLERRLSDLVLRHRLLNQLGSGCWWTLDIVRQRHLR